MKKSIILFLFITVSIIGCKSDGSISEGGFNGGSSGRGGSLAKFTITKNHLYVVDNNSLKVFNIADASDPKFLGSTNINAFAETIFPFKDHLLIGTRTGMFIFGLSNPVKPNLVSVYSHFASCDPVVAEGNYAYVTLRNGTPCQRGINQLDIIDISNFAAPRVVKSYQMINPHGLGTNQNLLFLCEGESGLKVFDKTDPLNLKELQNLSNVKSLDVIPLDDRVIITGKDGINQYQYTQKGDMKLLSKLAVE